MTVAPKYNFPAKTVFDVGYREIEDIIKEEYGRNFEPPCDIESSNYTSHSYSMQKEGLDEWDSEMLDTFKSSGRGHYLFRTIFQDLVNRDVVPEGEYVINVSW